MEFNIELNEISMHSSSHWVQLCVNALIHYDVGEKCILFCMHLCKLSLHEARGAQHHCYFYLSPKIIPICVSSCHFIAHLI